MGRSLHQTTLGRKKTCTTVAVVVQETEGKAHLLGHQEKINIGPAQ